MRGNVDKCPHLTGTPPGYSARLRSAQCAPSANVILFEILNMIYCFLCMLCMLKKAA